MRSFFCFVAIVACVMSCVFLVPAATEKPVAGESASDKSSPAPVEKSEETVPREFLGFADVSEFRGVIDDPDGYVNLRKDKQVDAPVITKVKAGEVFQFQKKGDEEWCQVKLKSGVSGWMHYSRIKLYFTKDDLPGKPEQEDEIDKQAREQGVNYFEVTQAAARGDKEALKTFLSTGGDGAAAEEAEALKGVMIHLIGDEALSEFLRDQAPGYQMGVRESLIGSGLGDATYPFEPVEYLRRHFPKTSKLFFRREIDFPSPDGRYALHKVFSGQGIGDDSRVVRSEVIEKATGKVIKDLTADDFGTGPGREGNVQWAPDSKAFLWFRVGPRGYGVTAYHLSGRSFAEVELPDYCAPNSEGDGARCEGGALEDVRWIKPNTLSHEQACYYKDSSGNVQSDLKCKYEIIMTIGPDGKVVTEKKQIPTPKQ
jgi:Bacterial SH3 domain